MAGEQAGHNRAKLGQTALRHGQRSSPQLTMREPSPWRAYLTRDFLAAIATPPAGTGWEGQLGKAGTLREMVQRQSGSCRQARSCAK